MTGSAVVRFPSSQGFAQFRRLIWLALTTNGLGDFSSVDWAHPEIEFAIVDGPSPGSWTGLVAMAAAWRDFLAAWEEFHAEADEYRELDDERVLVLVHQGGRGKTSGLEIGRMQANAAHLFHLHGGKVRRLVRYWNRERALTDLGLASETSSPRS